MWIVAVMYKVYAIKVLFARKLLGLLSLDNDDIISHIYTNLSSINIFEFHGLDSGFISEVSTYPRKVFSVDVYMRLTHTQGSPESWQHSYVDIVQVQFAA